MLVALVAVVAVMVIMLLGGGGGGVAVEAGVVVEELLHYKPWCRYGMSPSRRCGSRSRGSCGDKARTSNTT